MEYKRSESEQETVGNFYIRWDFEKAQTIPSGTQSSFADRIVDYVDQRFSSMKYILGLAIDFVVLAECLAQVDPSYAPIARNDDADAIFKKYKLVEKRGAKKANTLTLEHSGKKCGIRKIEESVADSFHQMGRTDYPSAYVYNTGQWQKYRDLLALAFKLDKDARFSVLERLWDFGLNQLEKHVYFFAPTERVRVFDELLKTYPRSAPDENGGLAFQAMAYGWCTCFFPHLDIVADKVRTGSKRQRRIGDFDAYWGIPIELSVEVKDMALDKDNYVRQVKQFAEIVGKHNIHGLVIARAYTVDVAQLALDDGLLLLDDREISRVTTLWDWQLQDRALLNFLHYLSHIEQNPSAVKRAVDFLRTVDPDHRFSKMEFV